MNLGARNALPTRLKVHVTARLPDFVLALFQEQFEISQGKLDEAGSNSPDALLCSIGEARLDAPAVEMLPKSVRAILTYSVGVDHIDVAAARAHGIAVFNTPGVLGDAVADAGMLLMLGAARRATESIRLLRSGEWSGWTPGQLIGVGLAGRTLGILGMGDIGRRVAKRARAFGMRIAYHNRRPIEGDAEVQWLPADQLIAASDVLLLAWPSTPETRYFIDDNTLALAKSTAIVVNIGRGDLVADEALIQALSSGRIYAAGLDVFDREPDFDRRYLDLPNAFLLPHIGSSTFEARLGMGQVLIDALHAWEAGNRPHNQIV